MALVMSTMVVVMCAGLITMTQRANSSQGHASDAKEAFHVAEAGLVEAFTGLTMAHTGNVGSIANPAAFGDGLFWVEARDDGAGVVELESVGMVGSGRATLELHVRRSQELIGALGFFADEDVVVPAQAFIDGYDSRLGGYAEQLADGRTAGMGRVGSNGDVTLSSGLAVDSGLTSDADMTNAAGTFRHQTTVDGEAISGQGDEVIVEKKARLTGPSSERASDAQLPQLAPPTQDPFYGQEGWKDQSLTHSGPVPFVVPDGEQSFEYLEIGEGAEVILTGPTTVTIQAVLAKSGARLLLDTTAGPVDLVVSGQVEFLPGSQLVTSSDDPLQASVLFSGLDNQTGPGVMIDAFSQFHGSIVAPDATVHIGAEFELFGALAAQQLNLQPGVRLHFDHALADPNLDGANRPKVISWRVVDIPLEINSRSLSPFDLLGIVRSDLVAPADAHEDQVLSIEYLDANGDPKTYVGSEQAFDWNDVSEVEAATRDGDEVKDVTTLETKAPVEEPVEVAPKGTLADLGLELDNPTLTSSELKDLALSFAPVPEEYMNRIVAMDYFGNGELNSIVAAQGTLSEASLSTLLDKATLSGSMMMDALIASSPLPASILVKVVLGAGNLNVGQQRKVLNAQ